MAKRTVIDDEIQQPVDREKSGLYAIINHKNGKFYIGSTMHLRKRWNDHISDLRRNVHVCQHLQSAFNLYEEASFAFVPIKNVEVKDLEQAENEFLQRFWDSGVLYNSFKSAYAVRGKDHPMWGKTHTAEARKKIKDARAKQQISHSAETRKRIGRPGRRLTEDHKSRSRCGLLATNAKRHLVFDATTGLDIIYLYLTGVSANRLATIFGVSDAKIRKLLTRQRIRIRTLSEQIRINRRGRA